MIIYVNQDTNTITSGVNSQQTIPAVYFKRGDAAYVDVIFSSNFSAVSASPSRQLIFGVKEIGKFDGDYIVYADTFVTSGNRYRISPNFNTVELNDLLNHGDDEGANDVTSVNLMLELSWSDDLGETWQSSNTINCVVQNDVNKQTEDTPVASQTMLQWLAAERPPVLILDNPPIGPYPNTPPLSGYPNIPSLSAYPNGLPHYMSVEGELTQDGAIFIIPPPLILTSVNNISIFWSSDGLEASSTGQWTAYIILGDSASLLYNIDDGLGDFAVWSVANPNSLLPWELDWTGSANNTATGTPVFSEYGFTEGSPGQLAIVDQDSIWICINDTNNFVEMQKV